MLFMELTPYDFSKKGIVGTDLNLPSKLCWQI
jgi:hypothetical protein